MDKRFNRLRHTVQHGARAAGISSGLALAPALALTLTLAGCGGGGYLPGLSPDDLFDWHYGAIAIHPTTLKGGITANMASQDTADARAVETCGGPPCTVVLRYAGAGACGALARAPAGIYGVGLGTTRASATAAAVADCLAKGGTGCNDTNADCND